MGLTCSQYRPLCAKHKLLAASNSIQGMQCSMQTSRCDTAVQAVNSPVSYACLHELQLQLPLLCSTSYSSVGDSPTIPYKGKLVRRSDYQADAWHCRTTAPVIPCHLFVSIQQQQKPVSTCSSQTATLCCKHQLAQACGVCTHAKACHTQARY